MKSAYTIEEAQKNLSAVVRHAERGSLATRRAPLGDRGDDGNSRRPKAMKAMRDAVSIPVTVKHRIGIDRGEDYAFVRDFVGTLADAGCEVFIVHARNA
eukprot:gene32125-54552_t